MSLPIQGCPICKMRVLPASDGLCPACRSYDFKAAKVVSEAAADQAQKDLRTSAHPPARLHPLALISAGLGVGGIFLPMFLAILSGFMALATGWSAARDIKGSSGRESGLRLARFGMVVGLGAALGRALVLLPLYVFTD